MKPKGVGETEARTFRGDQTEHNSGYTAWDNTAVLRTGSMCSALKAGRSLQWCPVYPLLVYLYLRCHATRRSAVRKRRRETADTSVILRDEASENGHPMMPRTDR